MRMRKLNIGIMENIPHHNIVFVITLAEKYYDDIVYSIGIRW